MKVPTIQLVVIAVYIRNILLSLTVFISYSHMLYDIHHAEETIQI